METNKESIVVQINTGKLQAYRYLFADFYRALVCYSASYIQNVEDAEDIVQEVFIRQWEAKVTFPNYNTLSTYLYTSVRNASLNWLKHQKVEERHRDFLKLHPETESKIESKILKEELFRQLFQCIEELPQRNREVLKLYLKGCHTDEIAEMLDLSPETVRTHRKNGLRVLRKKMGGLFVWVIIYHLF